MWKLDLQCWVKSQIPKAVFRLFCELFFFDFLITFLLLMSCNVFSAERWRTTCGPSIARQVTEIKVNEWLCCCNQEKERLSCQMFGTDQIRLTPFHRITKVISDCIYDILKALSQKYLPIHQKGLSFIHVYSWWGGWGLCVCVHLWGWENDVFS